MLLMHFHVNICPISVISINNQKLIVLQILQNQADYLGDNNKRQVHDLLNQKENC